MVSTRGWKQFSLNPVSFTIIGIWFLRLDTCPGWVTISLHHLGM